jgi:hypothetical protein
LSPLPPPKGRQPPYAIPIKSLLDLEAAMEWLTNSDSLWQVVSNLLNNFSIALFSNDNQ